MAIRFGMLTGNAVIDCALLAWFLAQLIKVILELVLMRRFDVTRFVSSSGVSCAVQVRSSTVSFHRGRRLTAASMRTSTQARLRDVTKS